MFIVLSMIVIVMEPVIVLFIFILFYVFSGPVAMLIAWHKKKTAKKLEPSPEKEVGFPG